jgi:hypothetical protein
VFQSGCATPLTLLCAPKSSLHEINALLRSWCNMAQTIFRQSDYLVVRSSPGSESAGERDDAESLQCVALYYDQDLGTKSSSGFGDRLEQNTTSEVVAFVGTWPKPYSALDAKRLFQALGISVSRHPRSMVWAMFRQLGLLLMLTHITVQCNDKIRSIDVSRSPAVLCCTDACMLRRSCLTFAQANHHMHHTVIQTNQQMHASSICTISNTSSLA